MRESGDNFSRLDVDVERIVAQRDKLTSAQKKRKEIEAQGKIVKDFKVGNTRIKINDAYCRDKSPEEVDAILRGLSVKMERHLVAQEIAKMKTSE